MAAEPSVSPADTDLPVRHCSRTEPHNPHDWARGLVHCPGIPLDREIVREPVSPADTPERVKLTTHKVVIDCRDEGRAADLCERLTNDGYRAHTEVHRMVERGGNVTIERSRT